MRASSFMRIGVLACVSVFLGACPPTEYSAKRIVDDASVGDKCNCAGYCFADGAKHVDECDGKKDLTKDFKQVAKKDAKVCDVVTYDWEGEMPSHFTIVVGTDASGATLVIGKKGDDGKVWLSPPDKTFGEGTKSWAPFTRDNSVDDALQKDIDGAAKDASEAEARYAKSNDAADQKAADAAWLKLVELCRKRNKLS